MLKRITIIFQLLIASYLLSLVLYGNSFAQIQETLKPSKRVRLLIWWEYISPEVIKNLEDLGFDTEITIYKTNEVAVSLLSTKNEKPFDVAVVGDFVIEELTKNERLIANPFSKVAATRKYAPIFQKTATQCLPYLWGTSVFVVDTRYLNGAHNPDSLVNLAQLKNIGYEVGLMDDNFEIATRSIADNDSFCGKDIESGVNDILGMLKNCPEPSAAIDMPNGIADSVFFTNTSALLTRSKIAAYAWHGVVAPFLEEYPYLEIVPAAKHPIIGYDSVCILKSGNPSISENDLHLYVETLTNKENTHLNSAYTQYFSPYDGDQSPLNARLQKTYESILQRMSQSTPIVIHAPNQETHARINKWWRQIRYAK